MLFSSGCLLFFCYSIFLFFFFFNDTASTEIYTLSLHDALPIFTFLVSMQISISSLQTHNVNRCGRSRHLARKLLIDRKSGSAGMPRPISYAVFCLKKKNSVRCRPNLRLTTRYPFYTEIVKGPLY